MSEEIERRREDFPLKEYLIELKQDIKSDIGKIDIKVDKVVEKTVEHGKDINQIKLFILEEFVKKSDFNKHEVEDKEAHMSVKKEIVDDIKAFRNSIIAAAVAISAIATAYFTYVLANK